MNNMIINEHIEKKIDQAICWLREQVRVSETQGLVVGVSGGIDSAVVANLIKRAFPNNSLGVILPIRSNENDEEDGLAVVMKIDLKCAVINLDKEHKTILDKTIYELAELGLYNKEKKRITDANLRARLRMSTIYAIANQLSYLVVGTDNAAELHTGYFTKFGDGGVDLLPIATLKKHEVYDWAKCLDVPPEIIKRKPSAGLWEGQTDEQEMGTTYKYIDALLEDKLIPDEDREIIESLHEKSMHKRVMPPYPTFD
ncbi:MAG: NAD(+) synthase [Clostridiales bacterium]|nr:NAD(+) synthase [Clostridiales bacterium]